MTTFCPTISCSWFFILKGKWDIGTIIPNSAINAMSLKLKSFVLLYEDDNEEEEEEKSTS